MTPARLSEVLALLGMTERRLAALTGYSRRTVADWLRGRIRVPAPVAAWLEALAAAWQAHPPPQRRAA